MSAAAAAAATSSACSTRLLSSPLSSCGLYTLSVSKGLYPRSCHGGSLRLPANRNRTHSGSTQHHEQLEARMDHHQHPSSRITAHKDPIREDIPDSQRLLVPAFPWLRKVINGAPLAASITGPILLALPNVPGFNIEGPQSVVEALGVLAAIVTVHECGHFFAAYCQNIHISKFAIGFGPTLFKLQGKKVEYSLRAIPLGGFVGFPDDNPESDFAPDDPDLLKNRPILDRLIVTSAGVIANLTFAYFILFGQVLTSGLLQQEIYPGATVPEVISTSVAAKSGIQAGDIILGVNGEALPAGEKAVFDLIRTIKASPNRDLSFYISRKQEPLEIKVTPDKSVDGSGKIGVQLAPNARAVKVKAKDLAEATVRATKEFRRLFVTVTDGLKQVLLNFSQTADKISGPVAIVAVGAEVARTDVAGLSQFAAIVNINLAVVNILPLPALDGGYILLILLEALRGGKKLPDNVEQSIMSSGIVLLLAIGVFLMVRDALNLGLAELL
ncbi:hypothetical protein L7F22_056630 [Adiantum nelumboides]|nr:hypothetical protein [Adiantum nelumboides]